MKLEFFFSQQSHAARTDVFIVLTDHNGKRCFAKPMNLEFVQIEDYCIKDPTLSFTNEMSLGFFPALVDGLAKAGYKYESSDAGELKATKVHLDDMRKLVFK